MKKITYIAGLLLLLVSFSQAVYAQDWPNLGRYRAQNAKVKPPAPGVNRVVFMGDSITDFWIKRDPEFFKVHPSYLDRGISGQTTPQMLIRFRADVIDLKPKVVVILAGTNDIAGNTGPSTLRMIENNLASMCQLAQINHIKVVLSSVLPASKYPWRPGIHPAEKIVRLNKWMEKYARENGYTYLNYYPHLVNNVGGMQKRYAIDGWVHPNLAGYKVMDKYAVKAIQRALNK